MEKRLVTRIAALRKEQRLSLQKVSKRTGISRATLSRLERGETSPTASMLGRLCALYGKTVSHLMAEVEATPSFLIRRQAQTVWQDPESGFLRRIISPPGPGLRGEMIEGNLPPGASVDYGSPLRDEFERHVLVLSGGLELTQNGVVHRLRPGDCLRFVQYGASRFFAPGATAARYILFAIRS
jgi:transcriptional regulator with XRE-family HTH domain